MTVESQTGLTKVLQQLAETALQPRDAGRSLPPEGYVNPEFLALERTRLFHSDWICIGRTEEIQNSGDFVTIDVMGTPIIAVRQSNGTIRAFSNVCLHRQSRLVSEARGKLNRIICPYHAWTYRADGSLLAAPYMDHVADFCVTDKRLEDVCVDTWEGFIYITLNRAAAPIGEQLVGLADLYSRYRMADYITFTHDDEVWNANWKAIVENFVEGYHLFRIHPETFEPISPTAWQTPQMGGSAFMYQTSLVRPEAKFGVAPEGNTYLTGDYRRLGSVACIFPSHLIQVTPDFGWYMTLIPLSVGRTAVRRGLSVAPSRLELEPDKAKFFAEMTAMFDRVNAEDRIANEAVQAGVTSVLARSGTLSHFEVHLHEFSNYLARRLGEQ